MVFNHENGWLVYLSLPLPTVQQLAARMAHPPSPEIADAIVASATRRAQRVGHARVDPYRIEAALHRQGHPEVSAEQVAWVVLTRLPVSR